LVYPALGVEAVRHVPAQSRGHAMGAYTAFLDVALRFGTPALGLLASIAGLGSVFMVSAVVVLCVAPIAACLLGASPARCDPRSLRRAGEQVPRSSMEADMKLLAARIAWLALIASSAQAQGTNGMSKSKSMPSREDVRRVAPALPLRGRDGDAATLGRPLSPRQARWRSASTTSANAAEDCRRLR